MNVLTSLLGELELELQDQPEGGPKVAKPGKLDPALTALNQQLADLELELKMGEERRALAGDDLASTQPAVNQIQEEFKAEPSMARPEVQVPQTQTVQTASLTPAPSVLLPCQSQRIAPSGWAWRQASPQQRVQYVSATSPRRSLGPQRAPAQPPQPTLIQRQHTPPQPQPATPQTQPQLNPQLQQASPPHASPQQAPQAQAMQERAAPALPKHLSSAQAMANAAMSATANLTPGTPATAPVLPCRSVSPTPTGRGQVPPPPIVPSGGWRSDRGCAGYFRGEMPQSPMRRAEGWQSPAPGFQIGRASPSPRNSGRFYAGLSNSTMPSARKPWRSPSEGRLGGQVSPGSLRNGWTPRSGTIADMTHSPRTRRENSWQPTHTPPHSFTMCRSSTSLTSSNPSFYMHSTMGGGGFGQNPVPAATYIVDLGDPVDQMLGSALRTLDAAAASKLTLRRLAPGRYEIDGRKVTLRWSDQGAGLMCIEDEVLDPRGSAMPLPAYLSQAGNVAASLSGQKADMPKIARVPKNQRLTFDDEKEEKNLASQIEKLGSERCESMRLAVEQARLREEAAEAYEKLTRGFAPSRVMPPPGAHMGYM
ncbi:unnamed protein product [Effrenium voratum]|uniref:Uncharacterized protein n=1 Tax=Effrenium voratum TaxID=2562239 RepID=A0AA36ITX3_9DINO|nr:unnamed protein product [Effrenium voratum]